MRGGEGFGEPMANTMRVKLVSWLGVALVLHFSKEAVSNLGVGIPETRPRRARKEQRRVLVLRFSPAGFSNSFVCVCGKGCGWQFANTRSISRVLIWCVIKRECG